MRTNGFEKPFSKDQVISWILQPLLMSSFIAFVAKLLDRDKCLAILLPDAALIVILLMAWATCESRDSAEPVWKNHTYEDFQIVSSLDPFSSLFVIGVQKSSSTSRFPSCIRVPPKVTRYCTICCKNSPGLDHHCTWLNTCIGESNYEAFYCLVVAATLQTLGQATIGILMATLWFSEIKSQLSENWHQPMLALLWVHNAICLSLANSYFLLAGFHTYLLLIGLGTYNFILANGSDGLCAPMLKCKCLRRSKKKNKLNHVVSEEGKAKQGDDKSKQVHFGGRRSKSPLPSINADEAMRAAEKKQKDVEEWKAEWLQKYGADDDDEEANNSKPSETSKSSTVSTVKVNSEASVGAAKTLLNDKVSARRTSTYPAELINSRPVGESQINMSININQSEDIFKEVDLRERGKQAGEEDTASVGPKTDL